MAIIKCPECGKEISDDATVCIHCGYPIQKQTENSTTKYYSVILQDCGLNKLAVIKYIRELTNLSLSEGKDLAEKTPSVLVQNVSLNEANDVKAELDKLSAFSMIKEYSEKQDDVTKANDSTETYHQTTTTSQSTNKKSSGCVGVLILIGLVIAIIFMFRACFGESSSSSSSNEVRCYYCSKVIVNSEGRTIHCHQSPDNPYLFICDYCGKKNYIMNIDNIKDATPYIENKTESKSNNNGYSNYGLTNSDKKAICSFIQSRYDYYDILNGGYAGDKYSDIIMEEAAEKYDITADEAFDIWLNMYSY